MSLIKRKWTAKEAEEWTKEDLIACIISPLAYITLMLGVVFSFLLLWYGFVILLAGIALTLLLYFVINPKLSKISTEYEKKQKEYLENLEKIVKWEDMK
ncbi:hypothetical protein DRQ09_07260 [candidate division KSB1 bacterium]|nr:MAG: hypothetical protein DRQ09_07260 [candidate division KSB1 bacterium]